MLILHLWVKTLFWADQTWNKGACVLSACDSPVSCPCGQTRALWSLMFVWWCHRGPVLWMCLCFGLLSELKRLTSNKTGVNVWHREGEHAAGLHHWPTVSFSLWSHANIKLKSGPGCDQDAVRLGQGHTWVRTLSGRGLNGFHGHTLYQRYRSVTLYVQIMMINIDEYKNTFVVCHVTAVKRCSRPQHRWWWWWWWTHCSCYSTLSVRLLSGWRSSSVGLCSQWAWMDVVLRSAGGHFTVILSVSYQQQFTTERAQQAFIVKGKDRKSPFE